MNAAVNKEQYKLLDVGNRPVAQILQCTVPRFLLDNGALWDICRMRCGIDEMG